MSRLTRVYVGFSKQANDANYGSETARCEFEVLPDDDKGDLDEDEATTLLEFARKYVHAELSKSPNAAVRRALEYPKPIAANEERWRRAQESAELELAVGRREIAASGKDEDDDAEPGDLPF
jgi:hypothetical protein